MAATLAALGPGRLPGRIQIDAKWPHAYTPRSLWSETDRSSCPEYWRERIEPTGCAARVKRLFEGLFALMPWDFGAMGGVNLE